jgi:hypothetical protein
MLRKFVICTPTFHFKFIYLFICSLFNDALSVMQTISVERNDDR